MQNTKFGSLGFEISRFGVGCMRLPEEKMDNGKSKINEDEAIKMIHYAIDNGVNYLDTAYPYHRGDSEPLVGKALKGGYREKVKLATKSPVWLVNTHEDFEKLLDEQLARLDTDCIDFYLLHALDKDRWAKIKSLNVFDFLEKAKKDGKIKYVGFSFHDEFPIFKEIADSYNWDMCQIMLNIVDEHYQAGVDGLHYAGSKGIPVVIMEPLKGGKLGQIMSTDIQDVWNQADVKRTPVEWAFRWLYNFPEVTVILSGVSSMEQLKNNLEIFKDAPPNSMTDKELSLVHKVKELYKSKTKVGCTGCNYCMPCPAGVSIPDVFSLYNDIYMYDSASESSRSYKRLAKSNKDVSKCIECKKCMEACPQHISIPDKLKEAHGVLNS